MRAPAKGTVELVVLSHDVVGRVTHFFQKRTRPCTREGCPACAAGVRKEWHGYIACWYERQQRKVILEVTAGPGRGLGRMFDQFRTLRGCTIVLGRKDNRPNGEVWLRGGREVMSGVTLAPEPDLRPILLRMWQVERLCEPDAPKIARPRLMATGTDGPLPDGGTLDHD